MMEPIRVGDKGYSNFMEEASRRISQTFQVVSGKLAELVAENALNTVGIVHKVHYLKNVQRTDFVIYHPNARDVKKSHRVEVKNVHLRDAASEGSGLTEIQCWDFS